MIGSALRGEGVWDQALLQDQTRLAYAHEANAIAVTWSPAG